MASIPTKLGPSVFNCSPCGKSRILRNVINFFMGNHCVLSEGTESSLWTHRFYSCGAKGGKAKKENGKDGGKGKPTCGLAKFPQPVQDEIVLNMRDCDPLEPECAPEKLKDKDCKKNKPGADSPFKSIWENPECCYDPCPDALPRFDALYYRPSDKAKAYQVTWDVCTSPPAKPAKSCTYVTVKRAPFKKRAAHERPTGVACSQKVRDSDLMVCKPAKDRNSKCPYQDCPGCIRGRRPPRCYVIKKPTGCRKVCTPYPAFSECKRPRPPAPRMTECLCAERPMMCEIMKVIRDMNTRKATVNARAN